MTSVLAVEASVADAVLGDAAAVVALDPVGETAALLLQPAPVKSHDLLVM